MTTHFEHREVKPWLWCAVVFFIALVIGITFAVSTKDSLVVDETNLPNNRISSHVLDISIGQPGAGIKLLSYKWSQSTDRWVELKQTKTNENGRVGSVHPNLELEAGTYKIRFNIADYFSKDNRTVFFPYVEISWPIFGWLRKARNKQKDKKNN